MNIHIHSLIKFIKHGSLSSFRGGVVILGRNVAQTSPFDIAGGGFMDLFFKGALCIDD